jgi:hypothetical protein
MAIVVTVLDERARFLVGVSGIWRVVRRLSALDHIEADVDGVSSTCRSQCRPGAEAASEKMSLRSRSHVSPGYRNFTQSPEGVESGRRDSNPRPQPWQSPQGLAADLHPNVRPQVRVLSGSHRSPTFAAVLGCLWHANGTDHPDPVAGSTSLRTFPGGVRHLRSAQKLPVRAVQDRHL